MKRILFLTLVVGLLLPGYAGADCRIPGASKVGQDEWVIRSGNAWPAKFSALNHYGKRGLSFTIDGQVCDAQGEPLPNARIHVVRIEATEDGTKFPTFVDLDPKAKESADWKTGERREFVTRSNGRLVASGLSEGSYALLPVNDSGSPRSEVVIFDFVVLPDGALAGGYGRSR